MWLDKMRKEIAEFKPLEYSWRRSACHNGNTLVGCLCASFFCKCEKAKNIAFIMNISSCSVFLAIWGFNIQATEEKHSEVKLKFICLKIASVLTYSML